MQDGLLLLVVVVYFVVAYIVTKLIYNFVKSTYWLVRFIVLSFFYALLFGIGAIGGGGEPGFALPAPVILAAWDSSPEMILNNSVFPFFFWWGLVFIIMISTLTFKKLWANLRKTSN